MKILANLMRFRCLPACSAFAYMCVTALVLTVLISVGSSVLDQYQYDPNYIGSSSPINYDVVIFNSIGKTLVLSGNSRADAQDPPSTASTALLSWTDWSVLRASGHNYKTNMYAEEACGFPFRCLFMRMYIEGGNNKTGSAGAYLWPPRGIAFGNQSPTLPNGWTLGGMKEYRIPLVPWVPGLLLNASIYWAALSVLVVIIKSLVVCMRRRRGLCLQCGYNISGLEGRAVCPECGVEQQ